MVTKKRILLISLVLLFTMVLGISFTIAYMSDQRIVTNKFEFGDVAVQVTESATWVVQDPDGSNHEVRKMDTSIRPGQTVTKDPLVENIGTVPCYVRATISVGDGVFQNKQSITSFLTMGALGSGWVPADGQSWFTGNSVTVYYNSELAKGAKTSKIFESVTLNATDGSGDALLEGANNSFDIVVTVEAVQTRANGKTITSAQDAFAQLMP